MKKYGLSVAPSISSRDRFETAILSSIFFFTGVAVVLPGTLLPLLSRHWRLGDGAAGLLFLCFSTGSSAGALLARGKLSLMLAAGCTLVAIGAFLLTADRAGAPLLVIGIYGCGLGLSMTAISLLRSRRWPERRVAELARLNLVWALGAGAGPATLLQTASRFDTSLVLRITSGVFGLFAVLVLMTVPRVKGSQNPTGNWIHSLRAVPLVLLCLIPLATGVESGIGSWLSSYIMRAGYVLNVTISATTAFGAGIIVSRILYSHPGAAAASSRFVVRLHSILIAFGIVLLMVSASPLLSIAAAFVTGLGVGPMYPFVLALLLNHNEAQNVGFLAGGAGASLVPMLIGAVSGWTHSLRTGLAVPLAAASLMLLLGTQIVHEPPTSSD